MQLFRLVLCVVAIYSLSACNKNRTEPDPFITYSATLNGASEETPTGSSGSGTANAILNKNTGKLEVSVTYTGLTPTAGHIHKGAVGVSGPVVFTFTDLASPILLDVVLDASQQSDLSNGLYYINLHSVAFPDGEIRGQLIKN